MDLDEYFDSGEHFNEEMYTRDHNEEQSEWVSEKAEKREDRFARFVVGKLGESVSNFRRLQMETNGSKYLKFALISHHLPHLPVLFAAPFFDSRKFPPIQDFLKKSVKAVFANCWDKVVENLGDDREDKSLAICFDLHGVGKMVLHNSVFWASKNARLVFTLPPDNRVAIERLGPWVEDLAARIKGLR